MGCVKKGSGAGTLCAHYSFFKKYTLRDFKSKIIFISSYIDLQKLDMFRKNNGFFYILNYLIY